VELKRGGILKEGGGKKGEKSRERRPLFTLRVEKKNNNLGRWKVKKES